jgi:hypothetical protein
MKMLKIFVIFHTRQTPKKNISSKNIFFKTFFDENNFTPKQINVFILRIKGKKTKNRYNFNKYNQILTFFFFDISIQEVEGVFELVTSLHESHKT